MHDIKERVRLQLTELICQICTKEVPHKYQLQIEGTICITSDDSAAFGIQIAHLLSRADRSPQPPTQGSSHQRSDSGIGDNDRPSMRPGGGSSGSENLLSPHPQGQPGNGDQHQMPLLPRPNLRVHIPKIGSHGMEPPAISPRIYHSGSSSDLLGHERNYSDSQIDLHALSFDDRKRSLSESAVFLEPHTSNLDDPENILRNLQRGAQLVIRKVNMVDAKSVPFSVSSVSPGIHLAPSGGGIVPMSNDHKMLIGEPMVLQKNDDIKVEYISDDEPAPMPQKRPATEERKLPPKKSCIARDRLSHSESDALGKNEMINRFTFETSGGHVRTLSESKKPDVRDAVRNFISKRETIPISSHSEQKDVAAGPDAVMHVPFPAGLVMSAAGLPSPGLQSPGTSGSVIRDMLTGYGRFMPPIDDKQQPSTKSSGTSPLVQENLPDHSRLHRSASFDVSEVDHIQRQVDQYSRFLTVPNSPVGLLLPHPHPLSRSIEDLNRDMHSSQEQMVTWSHGTMTISSQAQDIPSSAPPTPVSLVNISHFGGGITSNALSSPNDNVFKSIPLTVTGNNYKMTTIAPILVGGNNNGHGSGNKLEPDDDPQVKLEPDDNLIRNDVDFGQITKETVNDYIIVDPNSQKCISPRDYIYRNEATGETQIRACDYCGKQFRYFSKLLEHIRSHTKLKPYKCSICGRTYTYKGDLTVHIRQHSTQKPYVCDCGRAFASKKYLSVHQSQAKIKGRHASSKEIAESMYECNTCQKRFTFWSSYEMHLKAHDLIHNSRDGTNPEEGTSSSTVSAEAGTPTSANNEQIYECNACNTKYSDHSVFVSHVLEHENQNNSHKNENNEMRRLDEPTANS